MSANAHIGTSGWVYEHWQGPFYPDGLPQEEWFAHYADHFDCVEINNSFYQLPSEETFEAWQAQVPAGFRYAVKDNRYITYMNNLKASDGSLEKFISRARLLRDHLGPILWQLPPNWHANPDRLESFAARLPQDLHHAFEFREPDWFQDPIREILGDHDLGFVIYAMPGMDCPDWVTVEVIYLRFHGAQDKYTGRYGEERLQDWAEKMRTWVEEGHTVYAFFNNDARANAVKDARTLIDLLEA